MPKKNSTLKPEAAVQPSAPLPADEPARPAAKKRRTIKRKTKAKPKTAKKRDLQPAAALPEQALEPDRGASFVQNLLKAAVLAVLMLILVLAVDVFSIYKFGWQDKFSLQVAKMLVLPMGTVNGQNIILADYLEDIKLLEKAIAQKREGLVENYYTANYRNNVYLRLAADKLVRNRLAEYKYNLNNQKIASQMQEIINQIGGREQAQKTIADLYGLNLKQFQDKILAPLMARDALQQLITKDENLEINKEAKTRAEEVLRLAKTSGVDFASLANQYTEDEAGINIGGELGWMTKNEINPEWGEEIFSLPANTVYDKLIKNRVGYHIVKVEGRATNQETGEVSVKLRQILILVDVDLYIKSLLDSAKLIRYIR